MHRKIEYPYDLIASYTQHFQHDNFSMAFSVESKRNTKFVIIYHGFLPTPRRGSHVKSGKTHTQSSRYTP